MAFDAHALIGVEPHDRGNPIAFGFGGELLWQAWIGGFAALLSSEGTPVVPPATMPVLNFADRISVPFGLALRPLARLDAASGWWNRLLAGVDLQLGPTVEHYRTSDASTTVGGLHAALGVEVPLWGGPRTGGLALRLYGRLIVTPDARLDAGKVYEPIVSGQFYGGIAFYP